MDPERHNRIFELFHGAAALPEQEREAFLGRESGGDDSLVTEVLRLLTHDPGSLGPVPQGAAPDLVGTVIDRYRLLEEIGRGGQGKVYLADDPELGRRVAIKLLTAFAPLASELRQRFLREAKVASRLDHPGVDPRGGVVV